MADVAPPHKGIRARLGLGSSNHSPHRRKLVKKSAALGGHDCENINFGHPVDGFNLPLDGPSTQSTALPTIIKNDSTINSLATINTHNSTQSYPVRPRTISKQPPRRKQDQSATLDRDTGERKDLTDMLHAFSYTESTDVSEETLIDVLPEYSNSQPDGTLILAKGCPEIWAMISSYLTPLDVANLSLTCHTLYTRLGKLPYKLLANPKNREYRVDFLLQMDRKLPDHLFCFACVQWHIRTQCGHEILKPANVLNPLFNCPNATNNLIPPPRLRITEGRTLPFTFVQLAKRAWLYGPEYGIPCQNLNRRWKDTYSAWSHESTYHIGRNGHVLMRIKSQVFVTPGMTPAAKRLLLFSRGDYTPYFSVCAHWRYGVLTAVPKCALDHIPVQKVNALTQLRTQKAVGTVSLCGECRPMRRCLECPTEYLIELKLVEDRTEKASGPERFKQALVVTRWSDLGPARSPDDKEWAAVVGKREGYDSFLEIGRRAISGVFEGAFSETIPGQRILSMNPHGIKKDENWNGWY